MKRERLGIIDYCRIVSALAVVALHVTAPNSVENDACYFVNQMCRFAVPLFFLLSGMSLYNGYKDRDRIEALSFYRRRFGKILLPYLMWTAIYLLYLVRGDLTKLTWQFALEKSVFGVGHLYFILIIMQAYILFPLIFRLYKKNHRAVLAVSLIVTMFLNVAAILPAWDIFIAPPEHVSLYYMIFFSWMFFFVFGMYAADRYDDMMAFASKNRWRLWCAAYICLMLLVGIGRMTDTYASSMKPSIIVYSVLIFLAMFSSFGGMKITPQIIWLSEQSFAVYLCHILILGFVKGYFLLSGFKLANVPWLIMLCTLLCSVFFVYIASHIKYCEIIGVINSSRYKQK